MWRDCWTVERLCTVAAWGGGDVQVAMTRGLQVSAGTTRRSLQPTSKHGHVNHNIAVSNQGSLPAGDTIDYHNVILDRN